MHVIIPAAGFGTRLRPHTWSKPKPLVSVAGKPILGHVLDSIAPLHPEKVIFITGYLGDQIREYVERQYTFPSAFVHQGEMKGQAHAIQLARDEVSGPVLIAFADTIFATDLSILEQTDADGVIFVKEVDKPQAFGIVELDGDRIRRIIEKPADPPTNLAVAGIYYFRDSARLLAAIDEIMAAGKQTKGEFYLTDAIQVMIDDGARIEAATMDLWLDCGRPETLLETNRVLLARMDGDMTAPRYAGQCHHPARRHRTLRAYPSRRRRAQRQRRRECHDHRCDCPRCDPQSRQRDRQCHADELDRRRGHRCARRFPQRQYRRFVGGQSRRREQHGHVDWGRNDALA